jgi:hypothetical protein
MQHSVIENKMYNGATTLFRNHDEAYPNKHLFFKLGYKIRSLSTLNYTASIYT